MLRAASLSLAQVTATSIGWPLPCPGHFARVLQIQPASGEAATSPCQVALGPAVSPLMCFGATFRNAGRSVNGASVPSTSSLLFTKGKGRVSGVDPIGQLALRLLGRDPTSLHIESTPAAPRGRCCCAAGLSSRKTSRAYAVCPWLSAALRNLTARIHNLRVRRGVRPKLENTDGADTLC